MSDWSGQAWLQGFNDAGLAVFGMPANDLVRIKVCAFGFLTRVYFVVTQCLTYAARQRGSIQRSYAQSKLRNIPPVLQSQTRHLQCNLLLSIFFHLLPTETAT